jgi:hypothetical protein
VKRLALILPFLLATTGSLSGCSWIFVKPLPPNYQRGDRVDCTTSVAAPVADTLLALSNVAGVLFIAGTSGGQSNSTTNALVTSALVWTGIYIGSAVHGYRATGACRDVLADDADEAPLYPHPRVHARPLPPPPAQSPSAEPPGSPPVEPAPAPAGPAQQQDEDDPSGRPLPRKPAPIQPKPDAPRFGG